MKASCGTLTEPMAFILFLPLAWLFGLKLRLGLMALWGAFAAYRLLFGAATVLLWRGSRWQRIKV